MGTRHTGPLLDTPRLRIPARRRQLVTALLLAGGVLGATAVVVLLLLPRDEVMVLRAWDEAVVSRSELNQVVEASGVIVARTEELVTSPETATVAHLAVDTGSRVRAGDVLARLASPELEQELQTQKVRLARAQREIRRDGVESAYARRAAEMELERLVRALEDALETVDRTRRLVEIGAQSAASLVEATDAADLARRATEGQRLRNEGEVRVGAIRAEGLEAERDEALHAIALLEARIAALLIRSPIDGSIVGVEVRQGEHLAAHQHLFTVADTDDLGVDLRVPESQAGRVRPGQAVRLTVATAAMDGVVRSVGLVAEGGSETQAATVEVRVRIAAKTAGLIAGSTVAGEIAVGTKPDALTLPRGPWLGSGEARYVYKIVGDTARRVSASFGATRGLVVEVLTGLEEGDRVVVSSYQTFRDRETVRLERSEG